MLKKTKSKAGLAKSITDYRVLEAWSLSGVDTLPSCLVLYVIFMALVTVLNKKKLRKKNKKRNATCGMCYFVENVFFALYWPCN